MPVVDPGSTGSGREAHGNKLMVELCRLHTAWRKQLGNCTGQRIEESIAETGLA